VPGHHQQLQLLYLHKKMVRVEDEASVNITTPCTTPYDNQHVNKRGLCATSNISSSYLARHVLVQQDSMTAALLLT